MAFLLGLSEGLAQAEASAFRNRQFAAQQQERQDRLAQIAENNALRRKEMSSLNKYREDTLFNQSLDSYLKTKDPTIKNMIWERRLRSRVNKDLQENNVTRPDGQPLFIPSGSTPDDFAKSGSPMRAWADEIARVYKGKWDRPDRIEQVRAISLRRGVDPKFDPRYARDMQERKAFLQESDIWFANNLTGMLNKDPNVTREWSAREKTIGKMGEDGKAILSKAMGYVKSANLAQYSQDQQNIRHTKTQQGLDRRHAETQKGLDERQEKGFKHSEFMLKEKDKIRKTKATREAKNKAFEELYNREYHVKSFAADVNELKGLFDKAGAKAVGMLGGFSQFMAGLKSQFKAGAGWETFDQKLPPGAGIAARVNSIRRKIIYRIARQNEPTGVISDSAAENAARQSGFATQDPKQIMKVLRGMLRLEREDLKRFANVQYQTLKSRKEGIESLREYDPNVDVPPAYQPPQQQSMVQDVMQGQAAPTVAPTQPAPTPAAPQAQPQAVQGVLEQRHGLSRPLQDYLNMPKAERDKLPPDELKRVRAAYMEAGSGFAGSLRSGGTIPSGDDPAPIQMRQESVIPPFPSPPVQQEMQGVAEVPTHVPSEHMGTLRQSASAPVAPVPAQPTSPAQAQASQVAAQVEQLERQHGVTFAQLQQKYGLPQPFSFYLKMTPEQRISLPEDLRVKLRNSYQEYMQIVNQLIGAEASGQFMGGS